MTKHTHATPDEADACDTCWAEADWWTSKLPKPILRQMIVAVDTHPLAPRRGPADRSDSSRCCVTRSSSVPIARPVEPPDVGGPTDPPAPTRSLGAPTLGATPSGAGA
jgi:hypothetical protein